MNPVHSWRYLGPDSNLKTAALPFGTILLMVILPKCRTLVSLGTPRLPAKPRPAVYYDSHCGLCVKIVRGLRSVDVFHSLDFRISLDDVAEQAGLRQADLNRSAWLVAPSKQPDLPGKFQVFEGFYAFRGITLRLPLLWATVPVLWFPGVGCLGRPFYRWVALHRSSISHCPANASLTASNDYPYNRPDSICATKITRQE